MPRAYSEKHYMRSKYTISFIKGMLWISSWLITTQKRLWGIGTYTPGGSFSCRDYSTKLENKERTSTWKGRLNPKHTRPCDRSVYNWEWIESSNRQLNMCGANRCDLKSSTLSGALLVTRSRRSITTTKSAWLIERDFRVKLSKLGHSSIRLSRDK